MSERDSRLAIITFAIKAKHTDDLAANTAFFSFL